MSFTASIEAQPRSLSANVITWAWVGLCAACFLVQVLGVLVVCGRSRGACGCGCVRRRPCCAVYEAAEDDSNTALSSASFASAEQKARLQRTCSFRVGRPPVLLSWGVSSWAVGAIGVILQYFHWSWTITGSVQFSASTAVITSNAPNIQTWLIFGSMSGWALCLLCEVPVILFLGVTHARLVRKFESVLGEGVSLSASGGLGGDRGRVVRRRALDRRVSVVLCYVWLARSLLELVSFAIAGLYVTVSTTGDRYLVWALVVGVGMQALLQVAYASALWVQRKRQGDAAAVALLSRLVPVDQFEGVRVMPSTVRASSPGSGGAAGAGPVTSTRHTVATPTIDSSEVRIAAAGGSHLSAAAGSPQQHMPLPAASSEGISAAPSAPTASPAAFTLTASPAAAAASPSPSQRATFVDTSHAAYSTAAFYRDEELAVDSLRQHQQRQPSRSVDLDEAQAARLRARLTALPATGTIGGQRASAAAASSVVPQRSESRSSLAQAAETRGYRGPAGYATMPAAGVRAPGVFSASPYPLVASAGIGGGAHAAYAAAAATQGPTRMPQGYATLPAGGIASVAAARAAAAAAAVALSASTSRTQGHAHMVPRVEASAAADPEDDPTPVPSVAPSRRPSTASTGSKLRRPELTTSTLLSDRLSAYMQRHCPERIGDVAGMLRVCANGADEVLTQQVLDSLCRRFGVQVPQFVLVHPRPLDVALVSARVADMLPSPSPPAPIEADTSEPEPAPEEEPHALCSPGAGLSSPGPVFPASPSSADSAGYQAGQNIRSGAAAMVVASPGSFSAVGSVQSLHEVTASASNLLGSAAPASSTSTTSEDIVGISNAHFDSSRSAVTQQCAVSFESMASTAALALEIVTGDAAERQGPAARTGPTRSVSRGRQFSAVPTGNSVFAHTSHTPTGAGTGDGAGILAGADGSSAPAPLEGETPASVSAAGSLAATLPPIPAAATLPSSSPHDEGRLDHEAPSSDAIRDSASASVVGTSADAVEAPAYAPRLIPLDQHRRHPRPHRTRACGLGPPRYQANSSSSTSSAASSSSSAASPPSNVAAGDSPGSALSTPETGVVVPLSDAFEGPLALEPLFEETPSDAAGVVVPLSDAFEGPLALEPLFEETPSDAAVASATASTAAGPGAVIPGADSTETNSAVADQVVHFSIALADLPGCDAESLVVVAGSFSEWARVPMLFDSSTACFVAALPLPRGRHVYKFVADGAWLTNPRMPTETDDIGAVNNVLVV